MSERPEPDGEAKMLALTYDVKTWRWMACKALGTVAPGVYVSSLSGLRLRRLPRPELPGPSWVRVASFVFGADRQASTQIAEPPDDFTHGP